ncbi:MAG: hypothetical protein WBB28_24125 [Crinalium sp.]
MSTIKYQYGLDLKGQTINIEDLRPSKEVREQIFRCLGCNNILVAVLGEKRRKHFRHKSDVEVNCSPETYLHKLAKSRFYEIYNHCIEKNKPFWISFEITKTCTHYLDDFLQTCEWKKEQVKFDLTKYFDRVLLQPKEGGFIPDLLLFSNKYKEDKDKIFVEIAVTHQATKEKLQSGYRIIEINISEDQDIQIIDEQSLSESEQVKFINFKRNQSDNFCGGSCVNGIIPYASSTVNYSFFVIYRSGKSVILSGDLTEFLNPIKSDLIVHSEILPNMNLNEDIFDDNRSTTFIKKILEAHSKKLPIKNCYLCRYHGSNFYNYDRNPIFCKFLKKSCNSNEAANCEYYRVDPKTFPIANENQTIYYNTPSITPSIALSETPSITPSIALSGTSKFKKGKSLIHPKFGEGLILEMLATEAAQVEFPNIGIKFIYLPNCLPTSEP